MIFKNKGKLVKRTINILWICLFLAFTLLLVNIIGAKLAGKVPRIFGYSVMHITSGSMEKEIPQNSYILIKRVDAEEIKRGDIICFFSTDPSIYGMPNTHRVVEEPIIKDGKIEFVTRGDANFINDKVHAEGERLIGVFVKKLDGLTAFSNFLEGKTMLFVIIGLQICIAFTVYLIFVKQKQIESLKSDKNEQEDKNNTN